MPIYEFFCPDNNRIYQFLARNSAEGTRIPRCPDDPKFRMEKRVSRFAMLKGLQEEGGEDPFAGMDETKMEAIMAEMERDMAGMDENNPDPRQLGHVMKKMTDLMGDKVPADMRELVRRLEAGEDPEKLENEFGDLEGGGEGGDGADLFAQTVKKFKASFAAPVRDPKLYEMSQWS
jgi:hypothetical protein